MVLQRDSNGFAMRDSNGFATRIEWFRSVDQLVLQHGFVQQGYKVQSSKLRCFRLRRLGEVPPVKRAGDRTEEVKFVTLS